MKPTELITFSKLLKINCPNNVVIKGASIDSRKVAEGDLFFALPGKKVDGHEFLQEAKKKGAVAAVVHESYQKDDFGLALLKVPNVLLALQELARQIHKERKGKSIAITGSIGKTSTKEFLKTLLEPHFKVFSTPLSYNTESTIPLSILMADGDEDIFILEMGMSKKGDIAELISIAPPDFALVTTVAIQHATNFTDGLQGISEEKGSIFAHPKTKIGFYNKEIALDEIVKNIGSCEKITFSTVSQESDYFIEFLTDQSVSISEKGEKFTIPFHLPMKVYALNVVAACVLARVLNVPWNSIAQAAHNLKLPPMRFEKIEKRGVTFINDAYNANPDAMKAALANLPSCQGRKIGVIGEMNALGEYCVKEHQEIGSFALSHIDLLLCLGERCTPMAEVWKEKNRECHLFHNQIDLAQFLKKVVKKGDVVLLKGARALRLENILEKF